MTETNNKKILNNMQEKIEILNRAAKAYYVDGEEIISNFEYDKIYDELAKLEDESGIILGGSPTQRVGYEVLTELPKQRHPSKMLSLDKTKSIEELKAFVGNHESLMSWKLDGLTVVLTYKEGKLFNAVTRGNGEIGEVITNNARYFENIPVNIAYKDELVVRGEAIITYSQFEIINRELPEAEAKYKNPRNLCSGSVRQLNNEITAQRKVRFIAFSMVDVSTDELKTRYDEFKFLQKQGFETVEYKKVTEGTVEETVAYFENKIKDSDYPSDGLVVSYDDIAYGNSLGATTKFPRDSIAFKWKDEIANTNLREIIWSASRTGLLNPIAVFDPVELEGTTVSRASVHNVSILKNLKLGIGDEISVYKANMIIPQIAENMTKSSNVSLPKICPVCGQEVKLRDEDGVQTLYCENKDCPAKRENAFALFASRDALNIEGMSGATIERLVDLGIITCFGDFFRLAAYKDEIVSLEGFGEKSFENLLESINKARITTAQRVLYGLGIPGIGAANARLISQKGQGDMEIIRHLTRNELVEISGVGEKMAQAFEEYFSKDENNNVLDDLLSQIEIIKPEGDGQNDMEGLTFVITGSLNEFENRSQLKEIIQNHGGKASDSVSAKTDYLINNDVESSSSKNKKAKELGVPIISEEDFLEKFPVKK